MVYFIQNYGEKIKSVIGGHTFNVFCDSDSKIIDKIGNKFSNFHKRHLSKILRGSCTSSRGGRDRNASLHFAHFAHFFTYKI
jgi:hypothetical protein